MSFKYRVITTVVVSTFASGLSIGLVAASSYTSSRFEELSSDAMHAANEEMREMRLLCAEQRALTTAYRSLLQESGLDMSAVDSEAARRALQ